MAEDSISDEARRIEEDTDYSGRAHFKQAIHGERAHLRLGVPAVIAGVAAGSALVGVPAEVAGSAGLVAALLSGLQTFLQPERKAAQHHAFGVEYIELRNRARIFRTIEQVGMSEDERKRYIRDLSQRRSELNRGSPSISPSAFEEARKSIEAGESTHQVDRPDSS